MLLTVVLTQTISPKMTPSTCTASRERDAPIPALAYQFDGYETTGHHGHAVIKQFADVERTAPKPQ